MESEGTNIKFLFIPAGATGEAQPLDRKVFGALKSKGKSKWIHFYNKNNGKSPNMAESTKMLLESWKELSEELIRDSWNFENTKSTNPTSPIDQRFEVSALITTEDE